MKSYKDLLNSSKNTGKLRQLTDDEVKKLRRYFLTTLKDLMKCCEKHGLIVMLIGGSVIGAIRHKGFIPWDDDLDVAMTRADFEKLKKVFETELGDKYILSSPNYKNNASNRFGKMFVKDTLFIEAGEDPAVDECKIKIDIFVIENVPSNGILRRLKGLWCSFLMGAASYEETYEHNTDELRDLLCSTEEGKRAYRRRLRIGKIFSYHDFQTWMNIVDKNMQYKKESNLMGIPSGRGHYFGEIRPRETFLPASKGIFEGMEVYLPANPDDYCSNLYGADYMTLPAEEKRERHFFVDIKFKETRDL